MESPLGEWDENLLMINEYWFDRQQAIIWTNVDLVLWAIRRQYARMSDKGGNWPFCKLYLNRKYDIHSMQLIDPHMIWQQFSWEVKGLVI